MGTKSESAAVCLQRLARPDARVLGVYNSGLSADAVREKYGVEHVAKLASNENPMGASPQVIRALIAEASGCAIYPDSASRAVRQKIASATGVGLEQVVMGNGSEEILQMLCTAFLNPGDRVVTLIPSFGLHEIFPRMMGAEVTMVGVDAQKQFDVAAWEQALSTPVKLVIFSNPSNPVGCMLNREGFQRIIDAAPQDCVLVIDEAYYEYCESDPDYPDSLRVLAQQTRPWIVLRTLSKAYGLAGLRIGYGLASDVELVNLLDRVRTPFNINRSAQAAALAALEDKAHVAASLEFVSQQRTIISAALREKGYEVVPSHANFVFFDCKRPSVELAEQLLAYGVIVKPWRESGYERWIRVSVGSEQDNQLFLRSLELISMQANTQSTAQEAE
ncbi:histidinol-phosphate transaminase [Rouxiella sp. S1S-2]|uniref:histidinol-phosphate transaminase n=1 Tax=Rouxiella sp. S1S-2 TaxID=2653856 RepID=UPI00186AC83E|nr:histidinol-phosphate transaminase [Rouxiella sp. S1S-2]